MMKEENRVVARAKRTVWIAEETVAQVKKILGSEISIHAMLKMSPEKFLEGFKTYSSEYEVALMKRELEELDQWLKEVKQEAENPSSEALRNEIGDKRNKAKPRTFI